MYIRVCVCDVYIEREKINETTGEGLKGPTEMSYQRVGVSSKDPLREKLCGPASSKVRGSSPG